jgi:hypothetical protein
MLQQTARLCRWFAVPDDRANSTGRFAAIPLARVSGNIPTPRPAGESPTLFRTAFHQALRPMLPPVQAPIRLAGVQICRVQYLKPDLFACSAPTHLELKANLWQR